MGFMDKAKKLAEQAQTKLDEAQKQFNEGQQRSGSTPPPVEYDQHGRPVPPPASPTPPHGDPLGGPPPAPPAPPAPAPDPAAPPKPDDRDKPPGMSSGDPLAG